MMHSSSHSKNFLLVSCDGRVECDLNQQCVDAKLYLKTVFACIQSELLASGSDILSPALNSDTNLKRAEMENSRQREERVRTVMESNEARSANDSFSVTRTTNNISADITSTGRNKFVTTNNKTGQR